MITHKRYALLAAILSIIIPGLGHMYAGHLGKGLLLIGIEYGVFLIVDSFNLLSTFNGMAAFITVGIIFYLYVLISSIRLARKNKQYQLKPYNRWYWYLLVFIAMSVLSALLAPSSGRLANYQTFRIPANAMTPTLQVGDFITVDTKYTQPKVGDVVVFYYPKDPTVSYVKRVAALGNDTVAIRNGIVIRNGWEERRLDVAENRRQREYSLSMDERRIKENEIFFLGDNRDYSNDSRFWGEASVNSVIGKVSYIWFSTDMDRIGTTVE